MRSEVVKAKNNNDDRERHREKDNTMIITNKRVFGPLPLEMSNK